MLKENNLNYVVGEKCVPEESFFKVNKIISKDINENLQKGKIIILEGNFYHKSQIKDLNEKISFKTFIFTLKAPLKECINRDKKRNSIGEKRVEEVFKLVSEFDSGKIIDTFKKTPSKILKEIISQLNV